MITKKTMNLAGAIVIAFAAIFAGCNKELNKSTNNAANSPQSEADLKAMMSENGNNPDEASISAMQAANSESSAEGHYLYTEDNSAGNNGIMAYEIKPDGSLYLKGTTASGGAGTGIGLGSQGALVLSENHEWLFAVNAGSNSVSSFKVNNDGSLTLAHTAKTHGEMPVSVTVYDNMLYVLNHNTDDIHGFWIGADGMLTDISGSDKSLSGTAVDAPQISFSPYGDWIIVTEKTTNIVGTFKVESDGSAAEGIFTPSVGATPFGFAFSRDKYMIVSNAAGGAEGEGSATSYVISGSGVPNDVNGYVRDYQSAPCWFVVAKYGRFAYTTNTAGNTVSSYYISSWGGLYLVQSTAAVTDEAPVDIVIAANNYFVYVLNGVGQSIGGYHRRFLGGLILMGTQTGIPASATGLATY